MLSTWLYVVRNDLESSWRQIAQVLEVTWRRGPRPNDVDQDRQIAFVGKRGTTPWRDERTECESVRP